MAGRLRATSPIPNCGQNGIRCPTWFDYLRQRNRATQSEGVASSDQLVDEMVIKFTHSLEMDWMLPGIPPTGRRVEVPLVVIVRFRDGKLADEHIYWDQASVLVQLGLLDPEKLPVAGLESAQKVLDPSVQASACG